MLPITQKLIKTSTKSRPGTKRTVKYIVVHETGNFSKNADAKAHANYIYNLAAANSTYLSWHYTVDDKSIYQHIPDDEVAWHCGDGTKQPGGNINGIAIEICVNPETNFAIAMKNAAELIAYLINKYNLQLTDIKQHYDFSGKSCPYTIRKNNLWQGFINNISTEYAKLKPTPQSDYAKLLDEANKKLNLITADNTRLQSKISEIESRLKDYTAKMEKIKQIIN